MAAIPRESGDPKLLKALGGPWFLMDMKSFDRMFHGWHRCFLGHNRSGTVGSTNLKNAHPFRHSGEYSNDIIGMHNGTLDYSSKKNLKDGDTFNTDSEAIIANLAYEGPEKTISKLEGAYALVWYDGKDNTINMIRNKERPLAYAFSKDNKTLFLSSESPLLRAALLRNGVESEAYFILKEDLLVSFKIPESEKPFEAPLEQKLEGKKYTFPLALWKRGGQSAGDTSSKVMGGISSITPFRESQGQQSTRTGTGTNLPYTGSPHSAFQGLKQTGIFAGLQSYGIILLDHRMHQVFRDPKTYQWYLYHFVGQAEGWSKKTLRFAPLELNCSWLDINANHAFKHEGKKKRKKIFFKGFGKHTLLTKEQTEELFSNGCLACSRVPKWGNEVLWMNQDHWFLCEFCSLDPNLVSTYRLVA